MNQHIDQLFEKYLNGTCSPAEWQELLAVISRIEENDADTLSGPMLMLWEKAKAGELPSTALLLEREKMYKAVTQEEDANAFAIPTAHRVHFLKTSWFRYAAAIVIVAGATVVAVLNSKHEEVATTNDNKHLQTDVAPGGDKAVLTLADGSKIILDNARNGKLAQQGNTKVIKLDNGQLAYNASNTLSKELLFNTISTPRGGQYQIVLPDGSKVWLNAASSIKFPTTFTGNTRNVEMTGEAYMEVAKNVKQSFVVKANETEIQVLGTSFNVNAYKDEEALKTTLIEGSVKVKTTEKEAILKPGEQAVIADLIPGRAQDDKIKVLTVQTDEALAWKNGFFLFDKASIPAVMRQLSRWYDLDIHYAGAVPDRLFKGKLQRSLPLSGVLHLLEKGDIHLKLEGKSLTVLP